LMGWLLMSVKLADFYQLLIFIFVGAIAYFVYRAVSKNDSNLP